MSVVWQIEYRFPFDPVDDTTRVIYYKGTEDAVVLFMEKEAYELLKHYETESITWVIHNGNRMLHGKMVLPGITA